MPIHPAVSASSDAEFDMQAYMLVVEPYKAAMSSRPGKPMQKQDMPVEGLGDVE